MTKRLLLCLFLLLPAAMAGAAAGDGEQLFLANCAECHQGDGRGLPDVYPALAASEVVRGSGLDVALVMLIGRGEMPAFKGSLSAAEIAAIVNYVRNAWGNEGEAVTAEQIARLD